MQKLTSTDGIDNYSVEFKSYHSHLNLVIDMDSQYDITWGEYENDLVITIKQTGHIEQSNESKSYRPYVSIAVVATVLMLLLIFSF